MKKFLAFISKFKPRPNAHLIDMSECGGKGCVVLNTCTWSIERKFGNCSKCREELQSIIDMLKKKKL